MEKEVGEFLQRHGGLYLTSFYLEKGHILLGISAEETLPEDDA